MTRKDAVMWYDNERQKWRVAIGKGQKYHIGRYANRRDAVIALEAATHALTYAARFREIPVSKQSRETIRNNAVMTKPLF